VSFEKNLEGRRSEGEWRSGTTFCT
jgi:hypothetical protein